MLRAGRPRVESGRPRRTLPSCGVTSLCLAPKGVEQVEAKRMSMNHVTSSNALVTSSNALVTSSDALVTSSNALVTSSDALVTSSNEFPCYL